MKPVFGKSPSFYIPGYSKNAVIKLIIATGVAFVTYQLTWIIMKMMGYPNDVFIRVFQDNLILTPLSVFPHKVWTLFTYGWIHKGFWELVSNMIWLYCFGSLVQMLVGYKQIIPLYIYSLLVGGVFFVLAQFIPGYYGDIFMPGARAGLMGLAAAAVTLSPRYRFYLSPTLSIPLLLVAGIFAFLMLLSTGFQAPLMLLLVGSGLTGFVYVKLLRAGYKPGEWAYDLFDKLESTVTPGGHRAQNKKRGQVMNKVYDLRQVSEKRIDDILDKINQKGYKSLTAEERDILQRAGKEKN